MENTNMQRRSIEQLAVYFIESGKEVETLSLTRLRILYLKKTSETIYIVREGKLYGIISLGDVLRHAKNGEVKINKNYIALSENNLIRAKEIFKTKKIFIKYLLLTLKEN